jgi:MraZ protein
MSAEQFNSICNKILELPADKAMVLQYTFTATAVEVTPNAQGRVGIPQALREFAGIEGDALVIGMNNRIEIWSKQKFDEYMASQQSNIAEALSMLRL